MDRPKVHMLNVRSDITSRYARTLVTSKLTNPADTAKEVAFEFTIPETAFVSKFLMDVDGKLQEGLVKEKVAAKQTYDQAVESGKTAGHVATASVRDASQVRISVNVAANGNASFFLTYEELLARRKGRYELIVNLRPGQVVQEMMLEAYIKETSKIIKLQVPPFRTSELDFEEPDAENKDAKIEEVSDNEKIVRFIPSAEQQEAIGGAKGLQGKFVVRYDVERKVDAGEILALDGYFVHFFCPPIEKPLSKHVIFVLDVSGSMQGRKIQQLQEAMSSILKDLRPGDFFNILEFSYAVKIIDVLNRANSITLKTTDNMPVHWYHPREDEKPAENLPEMVNAYPVTKDLIAKAIECVQQMTAHGGTNIYDSVGAALGVARNAVSFDKTVSKLPEPLIIFLTDGDATVGETNRDRILAHVDALSTQSQIPMFALGFGSDVDFTFLKRLGLRTGAFARKIYEASDAALQLKDFYRQIASPLLSNVKFNYSDKQIDGSTVTKCDFGRYFSGSELVVCGKLADIQAGMQNLQLDGEVKGTGQAGEQIYPMGPPIRVIQPREHDKGDRFLERLWAFLSIRQLLEKYDAERADDENIETKAKEAKDKATELALKFSFVTPVTSLVVVAKDSKDKDEKLMECSENIPQAEIPVPQGYAAPLGIASPAALMSGQLVADSAPCPPMFSRSAMPQMRTKTAYEAYSPAVCTDSMGVIETDSCDAEPYEFHEDMFAYIFNLTSDGRGDKDGQRLEKTLCDTLGFHVIRENTDAQTLVNVKVPAIAKNTESKEECIMVCVLYDSKSAAAFKSEQIWKPLNTCTHLAGKPKIVMFLEYDRQVKGQRISRVEDFFFVFGFDEKYLSLWCEAVDQHAGNSDLKEITDDYVNPKMRGAVRPFFHDYLPLVLMFTKKSFDKSAYDKMVAERRAKLSSP